MEKTAALFVFFLYFCGVLGNSTYYRTYYGTSMTTAEYAEYVANGTSGNCTILVAKCNSTEGRRIDGTCNNLDNPSYGGAYTPYVRLLSADYNHTSSSVYDPALSITGEQKVAPRVVRTSLWAEGRVDDNELTSCLTHFAVFFATDITNTRDTTNYVSWRPHCCDAAGVNDSACAPNTVPADDFVHRFSGITCLNMTRPLTYQTSGCLPNTTTPLRVVDATSTYDLSPVYGNVVDENRRTYSGGQLVTVVVNNRTYPNTTKINLLLGVNFIGIIFWYRHHNEIANQMAKVNSSWTDQQLFEKSRDINIACAMQIFYYELMATLLGYDNLVEKGILANSTDEYRDVYNSSVRPQISLEYPIALRWLHSMQDGKGKLYDTNGTYVSSISLVNLTGTTNFLMENDTFPQLTQGCLRQPTAGSKDNIVDPDIVEKGLGRLQKSNDIMTNDLAKNRHFGLQGYIYYRNYCFDDNITCFDDLMGIIADEKITILKELYSAPEDIDLLAGIWAENIENGTHAPPTFNCIVSEQLYRSLVSDRHWFERAARPNAFTQAQLLEIRKFTLASLMCAVGDDVTEVQPKAFELPTGNNTMVSCDKIPAINYTYWLDDS